MPSASSCQSGVIVRDHGRTGQPEENVATGNVLPELRPTVLLTNNGTGSVAEIFAAALQEYHKAYIIGTKTNGCVGFTDVSPLGDGSSLAVTTNVNLGPVTGQALNGVGVTPDEVVGRTNADIAAGRDPQLDAAVAYLKGVGRMTQEDVQTATLTLHFVRHGETLWNRERRMQGQLYEVPLSDLGREQAREIASSLASVPAQALYSSDLLRTLETARAISEATGLPVIEEPALRERHFGVLQGRLYGDMLEEVEHAWRNPDVRPEGGESWRDVYDRAAALPRTPARRDVITH